MKTSALRFSIPEGTGLVLGLLLSVSAGAGEAPKGGDEAEKLLAEAERKRGPTFPGKDPAFLILPRQVDRTQVSIELLTPEVRGMAAKAVDWITRTQNADGSWSDKSYIRNTGVTGLCCLALMAAGNSPRSGKHGKALDRGIEFLLRNAQENGIIAGEGSNSLGAMYEHAYATLALLYAYGNAPWQPGMRNVISKSLQKLAKSQHLDGGWRYKFSVEGQSDISVTTKVLWVLRTAKKSGFTVDSEMIKKGVKFVEQCARPDGTFRYRQSGLHAAPAVGGTAIVALCNNGSLDHVLIPAARDRIAYEFRRYPAQDLKTRRYFMDGAFQASIAMFMCGDEYWVPFFGKTAAVLAATQSKDGEWLDEQGNLTYVTAMGAIVLHAPYGNLPLYER